MVSSSKGQKNGSNTMRVEIGEIDTSAPFQSVKDAVNLFGEGAFSGEKPAIKKSKPHSAERVLAKETQLHLAQKELNRLKEQLKNAETTKTQVLTELENAKRTVEDLNKKLKIVNESKDLALKATETAKSQAKKIGDANDGILPGANGDLKHDLEGEREQYMVVAAELDVAKQELRKHRQDCDAYLDAKVAALNQAAEAEQAAIANMGRVGEISKEISDVQESIGQVKLASLEAQQELAKIFTEKDGLKQSYKASLEDSAKKVLALKTEFNSEIPQFLERAWKLSKTTTEIEVLQKQMEDAKASDLESVQTVASELLGAKQSLQKVVEEESSLRSLMGSLKLELENVKKEHGELMEKEAEEETMAGNLHVQLQKAKNELEAFLAEESKTRSACDEMVSTLHQLSVETENARQEAEEMKRKAEELKQEAEISKIMLGEAEEQLRVALEEAEQAKAAEVWALDQIKELSERTIASRASTSESGTKITISKEEFESLSRKVEESDKLAEMKVSAAMAQVEAVKASENEALKRLEATQKEIEKMKVATEQALKKAQMAEAAKRAVEGELRRWREREQKKAAETASRILAEAQMSTESSPQHYRIEKQNVAEKVIQVQKMEKAKSSVSKKVLMPNLSVIFNRKKNQIDGGSPSYLPGEAPF